MIDSNINKLFSDIKKDIVRDANAKNKNLNNKIPKSIHWTIKHGETTIKADFYGWKWITQAWERGRGKTVNSTPSKVTLREKLEKWVMDRGLTSDVKQAKGLAYVISRNIHEKGTKGFPTHTGILFDNITTNRINQFFKVIEKEIINLYTIKEKS